MTLWTLLGLSLALGACAVPMLRNDVTAFHQWPANAGDRSYRLVRLPAQQGSLEHATYEAIARVELNAAGFRESPDGRFSVSFEYAVESRTARVYEYPPWGGGPVAFGTFGAYSGPWGLGVGVPIGGAAYPATPRDLVSYDRNVKLMIYDGAVATGARVWEGTALSSGSTQGLTAVLPYMFRALLSDFPGVNGATRRVEVELPRR